MKFFLANLSINLVSITCIVMAGLLALQDKGGWCWFLLLGLVSTAWIKHEPRP